MWCSSVAERWTWKLKVSGSNPGKSTSFSHSNTCNIWLSMYNVWDVIVTCDVRLWCAIVMCDCDVRLWCAIVMCDCDVWLWCVIVINLLILSCDFFRLERDRPYIPHIYLVHNPHDRYNTSEIRKVEPVHPSCTTCISGWTIFPNDQSAMVPDGCDLSSYLGWSKMTKGGRISGGKPEKTRLKPS